MIKLWCIELSYLRIRNPWQVFHNLKKYCEYSSSVKTGEFTFYTFKKINLQQPFLIQKVADYGSLLNSEVLWGGLYVNRPHLTNYSITKF